MTNLDRTLRKGARRIALARFVVAGTFALALAMLGLLAIRVAEKGFATPAPDWSWAWGIAVGAALLGAAVWVWMTRPDGRAIARDLDEKLGLKATLATAVWARSDTEAKDDAWHAATVGEGERAAARVDVRVAVPIVVPRYWVAPAALALVTFVGGWMPQQNVMALFNKQGEEEQLAAAEEERELIEIKEAVDESRKDMDAALSEINDDALNELLEQNDEIESAKTPEELRNAELRRLTAMRDRLEQLENGAKAESEALKEMTASIEIPEGLNSPVTKMAEALQKGDFKAAVEQLEELNKQLSENGSLTEEQKQALAQQMQQLANQLQNAAQQQQQAMQNIAKQAGLPSNLANNPQALQQAIQNAQNLTEQQKQQLQQQLQQAQNAAGQCQQCAGGMSKLAQNMGKAGQGNAMQGLQGQLSQMEMLDQQMKNLQAAQGQCQGSMDMLGSKGGGQRASALPQWAQKQRLMKGGGQGAGSTGKGGTEEGTNNSEDTVVEHKKASTVPDPNGPIIGSMVAEGGEQIRGESVAQFREAAKAGGEAASDAIDEHRVPKEYEDVVKKYFGGLEREAEKASEPAETLEPGSSSESGS